MSNAELDVTTPLAQMRGWRERLTEFFLPSNRTRPTPSLTRLELRLLTAWRLSLLVGVILALLLFFWFWLLPARNLAMGKPATGSSRAFGAVPSTAVDGYRYGQLGFHSDLEASPWLAIDLGAETRLSELKIFGRADCCYDQSLPLAIEVSKDGVKYEQIAVRERTFDQYTPWVFEPSGPIFARFVRLRTLRESVLVVSEVEVYGQAR